MAITEAEKARWVPMFFAINRWKLTGKIVHQGLAFHTAQEAEQKGRNDAKIYQDQTFERVFEGSWIEFGNLISKE